MVLLPAYGHGDGEQKVLQAVRSASKFLRQYPSIHDGEVYRRHSTIFDCNEDACQPVWQSTLVLLNLRRSVVADQTGS